VQRDDDRARMFRIPVAQRQMKAVTGEEIIGGDLRRVCLQPLTRNLRRAGRKQDQPTNKRRVSPDKPRKKSPRSHGRSSTNTGFVIFDLR
jgi:hypothetical protein